MAHKFRNPARHRRGTARLAAAGALGTAALTVLGFSALGAAPAAAQTTFTAAASSEGAGIVLFGTRLTGGQATVSVDSSTPSASAEGIGTLTPGLVEDQKASVSGATGSQSYPQACAQGGGTPSGTPFTITLGLACSSASASIDGSGMPQASATGEIAGLHVNVAGILNQIIQGGANQLLNGLSSGLAQAGSQAGNNPVGNLLSGLGQAITNLETQVALPNPPDTLDVDLGPASASVTSSPGPNATVTAKGETLDVKILPGVGDSGKPLVEIEIAPASATNTMTAGVWGTPASHGSIATISINIPGAVQVIDLSTGQGPLTILQGTPLETTITLGSASVNGQSATATGASVNLLKGVQGGIQVNLGTSSVTPTAGPVTTPTSGTVPPTTQAPASPAPALAAATSPTAIHTGEWWAGSLPLVGVLAAVGGGLVAWPRIRKLSLVAKLLTRAHR